MQRVALRMKSAGMFAAFARWQENIEEKKAMAAKSMRVVMRWKKQAAVRCLEAWGQLTAEEVQKRIVMKKIVGRMLQQKPLLCDGSVAAKRVGLEAGASGGGEEAEAHVQDRPEDAESSAGRSVWAVECQRE